jgi:hypothetical protein
MHLALFENPTLRTYKTSQTSSKQSACDSHQDVHRSWVAVKRAMSKCVKARLDKVDKSRDKYYSAIDTTEGCKAEDFNRIVTREGDCLA